MSKFTKKDFAALPKAEQHARQKVISALWAYYITSGDGGAYNTDFVEVTARYKKLAKDVYAGNPPVCRVCNQHPEPEVVNGVKGLIMAFYKGFVICKPCADKHWDELEGLYEDGGLTD